MGLVEATTTEGVTTLVMDDGKANVLSFEMFEALGAALDQAEADGDAVVLAGRPGRFSGGFHLPTLTSFTPAAADLLGAGFEMGHRLLSFPRPVVIACTGHAYAMGSFLLLCGDVRYGVAGGDHRITANEVAIGMTLPRAAAEFCRHRLTPAAFERATALSEIFDHEAAVAAGWLDELVPEDELLAAATARAVALTALDPKAHRETKARNRAAALDAIAEATRVDVEEFREVIAQVAAGADDT